MLTVLAFIVALGLLIAVHEWGHYRMAVACGVKVLRYSIGFGRPLRTWRLPGRDTEFVIAAIPLGGYVRMLDEREGPVDPAEAHRAFNRAPLRSRMAIVAAGPAANLVLAVALYAGVFWAGVDEPRAVLARPPADSMAQAAGVVAGDVVLAAAIADAAAQDVRSFEQLRWVLTRAAMDAQPVRLRVVSGERGRERDLVLDLTTLPTRDVDAQLFRRIGIVAPWSRPVMGEAVSGGPADRAGLREGDLVRAVDGRSIGDAAHLRESIRLAIDGDRGRVMRWDIERAGRALTVEVTPDVRNEGGKAVGRIQAYVGAPPETVLVRQGPIDGLVSAVERVGEVSVLTLRVLGRMVIGEASVRNLSGPLTIADFAGKSAALGLTQYVLFLALISVSLGVLNLLPLPVLDGGHLLYYFWEGLTGRPVSDAWLDRLQRGGVAVLAVVMTIALYNDVSRLFG